MSRAPFQVLVIPFRKQYNKYEFCIFHRTDLSFWQWISGGGEDDETPLKAAKREAYEEGNISSYNLYIELESTTSIPAKFFEEIVRNYPSRIVVPEYSFGVEVSEMISLSYEHSDCQWVDYNKAIELLKYDSNKTALYELNQQLECM